MGARRTRIREGQRWRRGVRVCEVRRDDEPSRSGGPSSHACPSGCGRMGRRLFLSVAVLTGWRVFFIGVRYSWVVGLGVRRMGDPMCAAPVRIGGRNDFHYAGGRRPACAGPANMSARRTGGPVAWPFSPPFPPRPVAIAGLAARCSVGEVVEQELERERECARRMPFSMIAWAYLIMLHMRKCIDYAFSMFR